MCTVIILLNGVVVDTAMTKQAISQWLEGEVHIIGVDGGCRYLKPLGLIPDRLIGDFDSTEDLVALKALWPNITCDIYPPEKDFTDAELAIEVAMSYRPKTIVFVGCFGGRMDHEFANLLLMERIPKPVECYAVNENNLVQWVSAPFEKTVYKEKFAHKYLSLVPLMQPYKGVTLKGVKYPLDQAQIEIGHTLGVSNELVAEKGEIHIASGKGLLIFSKD